MTKLRAFKGPTAKPEPPEREIFLQLIDMPEYVLLKAINVEGGNEPCGNLLKIYPDGRYLVIPAGEIDGQDFRNKGRRA